MKYQNKELIETTVITVLIIFFSGSFFILLTPHFYEDREQIGEHWYELWLMFPIFVVGSVCVWAFFRVRYAEKIEKKINKYS